MLERAIEVLTRREFGDEIRESLLSWDGADPAKVARTVAWVLHLREDLVVLLKTIDDPEQIAETLAINYIELKTRWIALNTKINYQMFRTGAPDAETACRGSACSMLLADVERLLNEGDITKITEFLAQPVNRAAA